MVKEEWRERARLMIPGYIRFIDVNPNDPIDELDIWLGTAEQKYRICRCTHCGEKFTVDAADTGMERNLWTAKHNEWIKCPSCLSHVQMKNDRLMRGYRTMSGHDRMMFAERLAYDHVILRAYYIEYTFNYDDTFPEMDFNEDVRYDLRPGEVTVKRKDPWSKDNWKTVGIREPWPIFDYINRNIIRMYSFDADEIFDNTWLQYLPFDEFKQQDWSSDRFSYYVNDLAYQQIPWARIMCYAALYPQIEYAAKLGAWEFIVDLVMKNRKNARLVNWKAKKPHEFLRMSKSEAAKVIADGCKKRQIELVHYRKLSVSAAKEWIKKGFTQAGVEDAESLLGDKGEDIVKYLMKQKYGLNGVHVLRDYRQAAAQLGRDLTVPGIRFPKHLTLAHDEATASVEALMQETARRGYNKLYKVLRKKFEYVTKDYMAIVPQQLTDIKLEGKLMHHCVGGYTDRHAKGACTIIFIRRTLLPLIPLYTVELRPDGTIVQIQGFNNKYENKPTDRAAEFVEEWKREINRRLAKNKKRTSKNKSKERIIT